MERGINMLRKAKRRTAAILVMVFIFSLVLSGCSSSSVSAEKAETTITDMAGREVVVPADVERVACQSSLCEAVIITLGKGSALIGSADYTDEDSFAFKLFPELASIKHFDDDISLEQMLEEKVQVVFVKDENKIEKYENAGMSVVCLELDTVEGTKASILLLGEIFGIQDRAKACINHIDKFSSLVKERAGGNEPFSAYYARAKYEDSDLFTTYAAGHIYSEWIAASNGTVITKDMELKETKGGVHINSEELLNADPDIIFVGGYFRNSVYNTAMSGEYGGSLKCVQNGKVFIVPTSVTDWSVGGCETGLVILWCGLNVYPELFTDIDMAQELINFYHDVSGITVDRALAEAILNSEGN